MFAQLYSAIPKEAAEAKIIDPQTVAVLKDFDKYFKAFPGHNKLDKESFVPRFNAWHPKLKDEQRAFYLKMLDTVFDTEPDEDQKKHIMSWLAEVEMATTMANVAEEYASGDLEADLYSKIIEISDAYKKRVDVRFDAWIDEDILSLMQEDLNEDGVSWRLNCLNTHMRKLRGGDFGIIAGRPNKGKTSFIASETTFMAPQLPEDRNIIWLNNEGPGRRIVPTVYRAALGLTTPQLGQLALSGKAEEEYIKLMLRRDRIRVVDIHGWTNGMVERVLEDSNPGIIIYDMIDKIKGFGSAARTDLGLEMMYDWARERSVKYDAIGLATSQISVDGDGLQFPTMGMLKDSKTGKQGACDFQIMIGASNDPSYQNSRFIGVVKNKLSRAGIPEDPKQEVVFNRDTARYTDIVGTHTLTEPKPQSQVEQVNTSDFDDADLEGIV